MKTYLIRYKINPCHAGIIISFIVSITVGVLLILFRIVCTGEFTFLFLLWNLFLAMVPLFMSYYLESGLVIHRSKIKFCALLMIWLLFLPNAPYIITDFFHLYERPGVPLWYDLVILIIFAWNGLMAGFISLRMMQQVISEKFNLRAGWIFVVGVLILTGFGVYIGRYLRYNSWDILMMPVSLFRDIAVILLNPCKNKEAYGMTVGMAVFLFTAYLSFYHLAKLQYGSIKNN